MKTDSISNLDYKLLKDKYKSDEKLEEIISKIEKEDYPVQYAIGNVPFLNTEIFVDERVLIPRFATELLVKKLIDYMRKFGLANAKVVDLCTGSGSIAVALKKSLADTIVVGVDKSHEALDLAKENAIHNEVDVKFLEMDILKNINLGERFDILVSNPPYVRLDEEVSPNTKYEPSMALYPGRDDLLFYKKILDEAANFLNDRNIIAFEIGSKQGIEILKYAKMKFPRAKISLEKDFEGYDRFVFIFNFE